MQPIPLKGQFICHRLVLATIHLRTKFEMSVFSREIRGGPKFTKVGHVTLPTPRKKQKKYKCDLKIIAQDHPRVQ